MSGAEKDKFTHTEEWARRYADNAGVEHIPLVQVQDGLAPDTRVIRYLFDRAQRFEASAVALRYVDKEADIPVKMYRHAENWLAVEVELPNQWFTLPEESKADA